MEQDTQVHLLVDLAEAEMVVEEDLALADKLEELTKAAAEAAVMMQVKLEE